MNLLTLLKLKPLIEAGGPGSGRHPGGGTSPKTLTEAGYKVAGMRNDLPAHLRAIKWEHTAGHEVTRFGNGEWIHKGADGKTKAGNSDTSLHAHLGKVHQAPRTIADVNRDQGHELNKAVGNDFMKPPKRW